VCSAKLRAERLAKIDRALRGAGGRWQLVTLTIRHFEGMPLGTLLRGLMAAWRRCRQGGLLQAIWTLLITASVRALEVTRGPNGWHPHLHVLLRTAAWTQEQRDELLTRFKRAVARELGELCVPDDKHAIVWSEPFDASSADERRRAKYLAKLGAEIAGVAKVGRSASVTSWDVARRAARGEARSAELWREFSRATRGRRMIEMDDRASRFAKNCPLKETSDECAPESCDVVKAYVFSEELAAVRRAERVDRALLARIMQAVETCSDPAATLRVFLIETQRRDVERRRMRFRGT
jgi:hypothetical protein